jgi:hypothetical protein
MIVLPETSKRAFGVVVPIPTDPELDKCKGVN